LDLDASRKLLVSAIRGAGEHNVLIDTRATAPTRLSKTDLWKLGVAAGTQPALAHGKWPCWFPSTRRKTRSSSRVSLALEGANVTAFSDFESAISWLILREQSEV
jgi:hypothetical protein